MHRLVVFASGRGSNAAAMIAYFKKTGLAEVSLIVSNKADAGVLELAAEEGIPTLVLDRAGFKDPAFVERLHAETLSLIVLAGFLWKVPDAVVQAFPNRIVNIHPALLPKHGGKGMWGHHVHEAVLANGDAESGITVHYVNEHYDEGAVLLQARCPVLSSDDADVLAARVLRLEHFYFPRVVEYLLANTAV